jgi:hypothetical protein
MLKPCRGRNGLCNSGPRVWLLVVMGQMQEHRAANSSMGKKGIASFDAGSKASHTPGGENRTAAPLAIGVGIGFKDMGPRIGSTSLLWCCWSVLLLLVLLLLLLLLLSLLMLIEL